MLKIGQAIRNFRKTQRYKLREFADMTGMTAPRVYQLESGRCNLKLTPEAVEKFAEVLKASTEAIYIMNGRIPPSIMESDLSPEDIASMLRILLDTKRVLTTGETDEAHDRIDTLRETPSHGVDPGTSGGSRGDVPVDGVCG